MTGKFKLIALIVAGLLAVVVLAVVAEITHGAHSISVMPVDVVTYPKATGGSSVVRLAADPNKTISAEDVANIKSALMTESARVGLYHPADFMVASPTNATAAFYRRTDVLLISVAKTNNAWAVIRIDRGKLVTTAPRGAVGRFLDTASMRLP